jgi:sugar lactone lactonase YvrE
MFLFVLTAVLIFEGCKKSNDSTPTPTPGPAITGFSPSSDTTGGTITITGTNFSPDAVNDIVKINDITATVISATSTQLTIKVPNGASNGNITVTVNGQTATSSASFTLNGPTITKFSPAISGIGYPLVIKGTNFSTDIASDVVTINGVTATVTSAADTQLIVTVPLTASTGKIAVTVKGQATISSSDIRIIKLTVTTIAGSGSYGYADGTGSATSFNAPWGIVGDNNGNYYVSDWYNNRIRKVTGAGVVTTFIGPSAFPGNAPAGIVMDSHGNLFVADIGWNAIKKITPAGVISYFAGDMYGNSGNTNGTGTNARFKSPVGLAIDANDNIYVSDDLNICIRKITPSGVVSTLAGSGTVGSADGTGTSASFRDPTGLCMGHDGNLYVLDALNNNIRKITPAGVVTTFAGNGTVGSADGPALSASFNELIGMVEDQAGNFYVTDESSHKIRMITTDGTVVTIGGNGNHATSDGVGGFASFYYPLGITIDPNGTMFEVDNGSATIRKIVVQ